MPVELIEAQLPDFGVPPRPSGIVAADLRRATGLRSPRRGERAGLDALVIYADREHLRQPRLAHWLRSALRGSAADPDC